MAVQKAAQVAAGRRGLRGAGPVIGEGRKNAAAEASRGFRATHGSLWSVYLTRPLTWGTATTGALPTSLGLPLPAGQLQAPCSAPSVLFTTFLTTKNGRQRARLGAVPPALLGR